MYKLDYFFDRYGSNGVGNGDFDSNRAAQGYDW